MHEKAKPEDEQQDDQPADNDTFSLFHSDLRHCTPIIPRVRTL